MLKYKVDGGNRKALNRVGIFNIITMKTKKLNRKLILRKETISNLNMSEVKGGRLPGGQTGVNGCDGTWVSVLYCDDDPATAMACSAPCAIEKP